MSPPLGVFASVRQASAPPPIDAVSSIPGTTLWLRGRDLGANGASITAWPDASGKQRPMLAAATVPVVLTGDTATGS